MTVFERDGGRVQPPVHSSSKSSGDSSNSKRAVIKRAPPPAHAWERNRRFGIVVDAGSSGSRLHVYSWIDHTAAREQRQAAGNSIAVLPRIEKGVQSGSGWTLKVEPGGYCLLLYVHL